jgi:hypothetical protein
MRMIVDMENLAGILSNRAWLWRRRPFPHVAARNVFRREFFTALTGQIQGIFDRGLSEKPASGQLSRNIAGYDAYGIGLTPSMQGPAAIFLSSAWRDLMCSNFGIGATPYVFAGVHHHAIGSKSGFIHNDYNPVWFPRATDGCMQAPNAEICAYKTGAGKLAPSQKIEVVRGAVVILFLLNGEWRPGDGGETGLYLSAQSDIGQPAAAYPPESNSLVAFECTPHSFHTFLSNRRQPRTSLIMWVHRRIEEATAKYGAETLEHWHD